MSTLDMLYEIKGEIAEVKEAVREQTGTYKYDDCYDDCFKIINTHIARLEQELDYKNIRSKKTKKAFTEYLSKHPHERFWQSVRNFSGNAYVLVSEDPDSEPIEDTFNLEEL